MTVSPLRRLLASRLLYVLLGLAVPGMLSAQGAAVLTGKIVDSAGAPIRGATVRVPQLERGATSDSTGTFRLEGLPTGRVTIVGEAPGFVGKRVEVTIPANGTVEQAFSLVPTRTSSPTSKCARARGSSSRSSSTSSRCAGTPARQGGSSVPRT